MKKVSVIVPVYNVEKYLPQCLDSLLSQSYYYWEAILIDDGSSDLSSKICDQYANLDNRFRVVHKENGGAASAKNVGLDCVTGEYVAFIDSDDYVEARWLEKILMIAEEKKADIVEFDFDQVYRTYSICVNGYPDLLKEFTAEEYLAQYLSNWTSSLFCNKIFNVQILKNVRFRKERRCIDDEFFTYKVVSDAKKIVRINDVLYHYRQRASSAVSSKKNRQQIADDALEVLIERYTWICERFPHLREQYLYHDVDIMFFFSKFSHTDDTVKKFRSIARYYLWQILRYKPYGIQLKTVIKLQFISKEKLLKDEDSTSNKDFSIYFE